ncbi:hypothetical protein AO203_08305 [Lactobacillus gallinarum]|nr:hypothetical protein AO203_08305 [Lactobacillus gallinarum]
MEKVEPMDILRMPSPEEETMAEITTWVKTSKDNKAANCTTVVFKKNTPKKILDLFQKIMIFSQLCLD